MKTAILIHGTCDEEEYFSDLYPSLSNSHWFPWLQKQLLIKGIFTQTPEMPDAYKPDYEKWKKFVVEKQLGGIQLYADKNWMSDFIKAFGINSIPRFILIDPTGKVVNADADRPSNPKLQEQLDAFLKQFRFSTK